MSDLRSFDSPHLSPLLPLVYVAWSDGDLSPAEITVLCEEVSRQGVLDDDTLQQLQTWLDPHRPPSARELRGMFRRIHAAAEHATPSERKSLAGLGAALARQDLDASGATNLPLLTQAALEGLHSALGVGIDEAAADLLRPTPEQAPPPTTPVPSFDVPGLRRLLDGKEHTRRDAIRDLLKEAPFRYVYDVTKATHREQVLDWIGELSKRGIGRLAYPSVFGEAEDLGEFIAIFETLAFFDLSLVIKFGVQFGLFGGSIYFLGTEKHHSRWLEDIAEGRLLGCFAMTETGHGSNVRDLETTITYVPETDSFRVHTPHAGARKDYIGNAACHGTLATVFGQLIIGEDNHGVHAVMVPIRTPSGDPLPNIHIEDCGAKLGLNGVDNGRIAFDQVEVPRSHLLDRLAQVDEHGQYHSDIASDSRRFFTTLGTLVGGRVSVACAALSATKSALAIAVLYGSGRRQFGPSGEHEVSVLDYQTHQRRLMPRLARTYALNFALRHLVDRYLARSDDDAQEVEALAAGLKAMATWHATDTIQTCRECCGGNGYLAVNRFAALKADTDVFSTFEGDNTVLMQLVTKGLLSQFRRQFSDPRLFTILRFIGEQASSTLSRWNPVTTRNTDPDHLRDREWQVSMLQHREKDLVMLLARRLKKRIDDGMDSFAAYNACQNHAMAVAHAHIDAVVLEQFVAGVATAPSELRPVLERLCDLYALSVIEAGSHWFLEEGYLTASKSKAIRKEVTALCAELRPDAIHLVDAFGIPDSCLGAPISGVRPA